MTIVIAVGNTLRRDDGVAHRVLEMLAPLPVGTTAKAVHQLTPELADYIKDCDRVLIIDADIDATEPCLQKMDAADAPPRSSLGHVVPAAEVISLARLLYGFTGEAWVCRLPVVDLDHGDVLTPEIHSAAKAAAVQIRGWLLQS
jgi:hydrogenase maturation protease